MRKVKSGNFYVAKNVTIRSVQMLAAIFPQRCSAKHKKKLIKESLVCSRKGFDALKYSVCVARHTAVMTLSAASLISAPTV